MWVILYSPGGQFQFLIIFLNIKNPQTHEMLMFWKCVRAAVFILIERFNPDAPDTKSFIESDARH